MAVALAHRLPQPTLWNRVYGDIPDPLSAALPLALECQEELPSWCKPRLATKGVALCPHVVLGPDLAVTYHNWKHAFSVTQCMYAMLQDPTLETYESAWHSRRE